MMSEATINLLAQIPLAGVIVLVVLVFLNFMAKNNATMMSFIDSLQQQHQRFMDSLQESHQNFISEQREQSNAALGRMADEIKAAAMEINKMNGLLTAHDASVRASLDSRNQTRTKK